MVEFKEYIGIAKKEVRMSFANNKWLLLIAVIFVIPMVFSYLYPDMVSEYINPIVESFEQQIEDGVVTLTTDSLFINNVSVAFLLYAMSALGAVLGVVVLANNGMLIGFFGTKTSLATYLALVLPHGIFEIPAIIIATAGGFVLLDFAILFIYNLIKPDYSYADIFDPYFTGGEITLKQRFSSGFNKYNHKLKESVILFAVSVVLLIVAAFIEANITMPLALQYSIFPFNLF